MPFTEPWEKIEKHPSYLSASPEKQKYLRGAWEKDTGYQPEAAPERTLGGTLKDAAVTTGKGVVGLGEGLVGIANIPTFGFAGKALEKVGYRPQELQESLSSQYSPAQQEANRQVEEAEGFFGTAREMIENPSTIAHGFLESAPSMIGGMGIARGLASKIPQLATKTGRIAGAAIGEGAISGGAMAEGTRQQTESGLLTPTQSLKAVASGIGTGAFALAGGRLAKKFGFTDLDTMLAGGGGVKSKNFTDVVKGIVQGGISEGVFEEMPQSMQEQIWSNSALDRPLLEGVPESGAQGMLVGAAMGGGANVSTFSRDKDPIQDSFNKVYGKEEKGTEVPYYSSVELEQQARVEQMPTDAMRAGAQAKFNESPGVTVGDMNEEVNRSGLAEIEGDITSGMEDVQVQDDVRGRKNQFEEMRDAQTVESIAAKIGMGEDLSDDEIAFVDNIKKAKDKQSKAKQLAIDLLGITPQQFKESGPQAPTSANDSALAAQEQLTENQQIAERRADARDTFGEQGKREARPFDVMLKQLKEGEVSGSFQREDGETSPAVSTYPGWYKQKTVKAYNKKHGTKIVLSKQGIEAVLGRVQSGKPLTARQQDTFDYLKSASETLQDQDLAAGESYDNLNDDGFKFENEKVPVGNLNPGDEVVVDNNGIPDKLTHMGYDGDGNAILQDGKTIIADPFEVVDTLAKKSKGQENEAAQAIIEKINEAKSEDLAAIEEGISSLGQEFSPYQEVFKTAIDRKKANVGAVDPRLPKVEPQDALTNSLTNGAVVTAQEPEIAQENVDTLVDKPADKREPWRITKAEMARPLSDEEISQITGIVEGKTGGAVSDGNLNGQKVTRGGMNGAPWHIQPKISELVAHKSAVGKAIADGKDVPQEVLADYPELVKQPSKEKSVQAQAVEPEKAEEVKAESRKKGEPVATYPTESLGEKSFLIKGHPVEIRAKLKEGGFKLKGTTRKEGVSFSNKQREAVEGVLTVEAEGLPKLEDVGEKLGGARKDMAYSFKAELSDDEIASQPLSKIWPKKDNDKIEDTFLAAFANAARAELPAKPRKGAKLERWTKLVKALRGTLTNFVESTEKGQSPRERFLENTEKHPVLSNFFHKVLLLEKVPREHWDRIGRVSVYPDSYRYGTDGSEIPSPFSTVVIDKRQQRFDGAKNVSDFYDKVVELLAEQEATAPKAMKFEVRGRGGSYFINKKGDSLYRKLKIFATSKEALAYRNTNQAELVAEWEKVKERDNVKKTDLRRKENMPRTGADHRQGRNVGSQEFKDTFGFRGVEFGKWVKQGKESDDRQGMVNDAYDSLMDMANILGIPPKAISLNGTLGLGLGSRGSGWASAHYEPDRIVINLTKTRGSGSIGHEFFHALDNYFSRQRGGEKKIGKGFGAQGSYRENNYITYKPEPLYVNKNYEGQGFTKTRLGEYRKSHPQSDYWKAENWHLDPNHPRGVRTEVEKTFSALVQALDNSPMSSRSSLIDKGKSGGYWGRIIERGARAFENYLISKMADEGYRNDHLANVVSIKEFARDPGRYPYLTAEEIAPVKEAFDTLFSEIKTKDTDKGVALYSKATGSVSNPADVKVELEESLGKAGVNNLTRKGLLEIVSPEQAENILAESEGAEVNATQDAKRKTGFTIKGKTYLIQGSVEKGDTVPTYLHELSVHLRQLDFHKTEDFQKVIKSVLKRKDHKGRVGDEVRAALAQIPEGTLGEHQGEEALAYLISNGRTEIGLVRRFIAALKKFLVEKLRFTPRILNNLDLSALALNVLKRDAGVKDQGKTVSSKKPKFAMAAEAAFDNDTAEAASEFKGNIQYITSDKRDLGFFKKILSSAEYIFQEAGGAAKRMFEANQNRRQNKFELEEKILGDYVPAMEKAKKETPGAYKRANKYVLDVDKSGEAYHLKRRFGYTVHTPGGDLVGIAETKVEAYKMAQNAKNKKGDDSELIKDYPVSEDRVESWDVINPKGEVISENHADQEVATKLMLLAENNAVAKKKGKKVADIVTRFREMTNRAFDKMVEDMRKVLDHVHERGLDEPTVAVVDETKRWAVVSPRGEIKATFGDEQTAKNAIMGVGQVKGFKGLKVKKQKDGEIRKEVNLSEAIAMMGDLRGYYFPRQRQPGEFILRAVKGNDKFMKKFDVHMEDQKYIDMETGQEMKRPMSKWLKKSFNTATGFVPFIETLEKTARQMKKEGYEVTIGRDTSTPESVFDAAQLMASVDSLMQNALTNSKKENQGLNEKAANELNKILTANLADIFKTRGYLSSRKKRTVDYWRGFEEDMLIAGTRYAKGLAGGFAKRQAAQEMTLALTGRDVSWKDWKADNDGGTWDEYEEFVNDRRLNPNEQKRLYAESMSFMEEVLRNEEQADRIMGTLKGLAVLKFLGFRVSSAAVNATNMVQAVPATISSHTGSGLTQAFKAVQNSVTQYGKYRSGKGNMSDKDRAVFQEISEKGWDDAQFNTENAAAIRSKAGNAWSNFMGAAMYVFGAVEKVNRATTIFAAYKQLRKNTELSHEAAMEKAKHVSDRAHGVYGKATMPAWTRGAYNPLKLTYTFQKFSHNYLLNMIEMGYKGDKKEAAYMLISPAILAGAGASLLTPLLAALAPGDDPEEDYYRWAYETFGAPGERMARHGVFGLAGVNLKGSLQMNNPMPRNLWEVGGAPLGVYKDTVRAAKHFSKGELTKGGEALLPAAFGNMIKSAREAREGITTGSYSPVFYGDEPIKADAFDQALRFFSFNPSRISGLREKQWNEKEVAARYQKKRSEVISKFKRYYLYGHGDLTELRKELFRYNEKVRGSGRRDIRPLTMKAIKSAVKRARKPSRVERMRAAA